MAGSPPPRLETSGNPAHAPLERAVQTQLDGIRGAFRNLDAASLNYSPGNISDWTGGAPSTIAEALDRIAAALGPIP